MTTLAFAFAGHENDQIAFARYSPNYVERKPVANQCVTMESQLWSAIAAQSNTTLPNRREGRIDLEHLKEREYRRIEFIKVIFQPEK